MERRKNILKLLFAKLLNRETISYLIFGVITTGINIGIYQLCRTVHIVYWISTIIAWVIALIFAFVTNKIFVFESTNMQSEIIFKEAVTFVAARLLSGLCDLLFMIFAVEIIHMDDFIAKIITNVFVVVINYLCSKLIVFKKSDQNAVEAADRSIL